VRTSTNPTGPEVNDHVNLQWPSYEQPQGSNLRPQREQTSWSQALTTGPPTRRFEINVFTSSNPWFKSKCIIFYWFFYSIPRISSLKNLLNLLDKWEGYTLKIVKNKSQFTYKLNNTFLKKKKNCVPSLFSRFWRYSCGVGTEKNINIPELELEGHPPHPMRQSRTSPTSKHPPRGQKLQRLWPG